MHRRWIPAGAQPPRRPSARRSSRRFPASFPAAARQYASALPSYALLRSSTRRPGPETMPWLRPPDAAAQPGRKPPAPPPGRCGTARRPACPARSPKSRGAWRSRSSPWYAPRHRGNRPAPHRWPPAPRAAFRRASRPRRPRRPACAPPLPSRRPPSRASVRWRRASRAPPRWCGAAADRQVPASPARFPCPPAAVATALPNPHIVPA